MAVSDGSPLAKSESSAVMETNRRLLFVVPDARFFVTHRSDLARAARVAGWEVHVATAAGPWAERIRKESFSWYRIEFGSIQKRPWSVISTIFRLTRLYLRLRPAVVHHVTSKPVLFGTIAARIARVPALANALTGLGDAFSGGRRSDSFWRTGTIWSFRALVRHRCMSVIFQNEDDLELMVERRAIPRANAVVIRGSGVEPDRFRPFENRHPDKVTVSCLSRLVRTKGVEDFAAASRELRRAGLNVRFIIAGERDSDSAHSIPDSTLLEWSRDGLVELIGYVEDPREVYAVSDIVCLPSHGGEGVPKTLIEAASCQLPIVTTDVPGCRDIVGDGVNGFVVPPRSVPELARAIRQLVESEELREAFGREGRRRVLSSFTLTAVIDQTLDIYDALLECAGSTGKQEHSGSTRH